MSNRPGALQSCGGARLQLVGDPQANTDGVNKKFIRYDWNTGCVGKPGASEIFPYFVSPISFVLPANLVGSIAEIVGGIGAAATANNIFNLNRVASGATTVGTVATLTFNAGAILGVFALNADFNISRGDVLFWQAPATQDNTLSDFGILVAGLR